MVQLPDNVTVQSSKQGFASLFEFLPNFVRYLKQNVEKLVKILRCLLPLLARRTRKLCQNRVGMTTDSFAVHNCH